MKKEGIVLKLDGQYLEVWSLENASCNSFENKRKVNDEVKVHDCSSCSGCSSSGSNMLKTIRVLNKSGKEIKVGDKINYSINFLGLQFFIVVLLPFLAFGLSFFSFHIYSYNEALCILFSFLTSFLIMGFNFVFTKKLFKTIFIPFV